MILDITKVIQLRKNRSTTQYKNKQKIEHRKEDTLMANKYMNNAQYHQSSEKYIEKWPKWLKLKRLTILNFGGGVGTHKLLLGM